MSGIEKRARELVTALMQDDPDEGESWEKMARRKLTAALTPPEGYVLVPVDSVKQCACGCGRFCCTHCGTELGGFAARPEAT
jgi:hypothetical protein